MFLLNFRLIFFSPASGEKLKTLTITNLSILQPGQQWQKAKIRLVTKIFLEPDEPAQEQNSAEVSHQGITLDLAEDLAKIEPAPIVYKTPATNLDVSIPQIYQNESEASNLGSDLEVVTADSLFDRSPELDLSSSQDITDVVESSDLISDSITANSLFDDFSEPALPSSETNNLILDSKLDSNLDSDLNSITADSLFDDFPESTLSASKSVRVVNDITESTDFSDSLFDDFMNVDSSNGYVEDLSVPQVNEEPQSVNSGDDLFGSFSPSDRASDRSLESNVAQLEDDTDDIKSRISKQNLDKLLQLMDEEEQIKAESAEAIKNKEIDPNIVQSNPDLGATTIERILGNMKTISLNTSESTSSPDFITLEELSGDLNSVGF